MQRVDSLEKTLMLGGIGGRRRRGQQRMRWIDGITDSMDMNWCPCNRASLELDIRELVRDREAWHAVIHGVAKSWTWLSNWSDLIWFLNQSVSTGECNLLAGLCLSFWHWQQSQFPHWINTAPNFNCLLFIPNIYHLNNESISFNMFLFRKGLSFEGFCSR